MMERASFSDVRFVEHDGARMPVHDMTPVIPVFRADRDAEDAFQQAGGRFLEAHAYRDAWKHSGTGCDIVAYAVAPAWGARATGQEGGAL